MAINRRKVIEDMSKLEFIGNQDGLIEGFGVMVNQLPASFWTSFSERLTSRANEDMLEATEYLLINAAHECGYHTGHGIINSPEWKAIVGPMVNNAEDVLHGAFAVLSAWGWAKAEIAELIPGQKLVVRAVDYYEADTVKFGKSSKKSAYMLRGICAAFMDLAYGGDYDVKGKKSIYTFKCEQTKGIECGDDCAEFVVTKN